MSLKKRNNMIKHFRTLSIAILCMMTGFTLMSHMEGHTTARPTTIKSSKIKTPAKINAPAVKSKTVFTPKPKDKVLTTQIVVLQFSEAELVYNEGIGNEWSTWMIINGQKLYEGDQITVSTTGQIKLSAHILEDDSSQDDYNYETYYITQRDLQRGSSLTYEVSVTEPYGRGAGGSATWRFHLTSESI